MRRLYFYEIVVGRGFVELYKVRTDMRTLLRSSSLDNLGKTLGNEKINIFILKVLISSERNIYN